MTFSDRRSRLVIGAAAAILFTLSIARVVATYGVFSQTVDEPIHVMAGYQWLVSGEYDHDPEHPPLARVGLALGMILDGTSIAPGSKDNSLLYRDDRYEQNLARVRMGNLPWLILTLGVVFIWARRLFGSLTAVIALGLLATLPPLLGHAGLATTDLSVTATTTLALLALAGWLERPAWSRAAMLAVTIGLGVVSKFSFLIFFPAAAIVFLIARWFSSKSDEASALAGREAPPQSARSVRRLPQTIAGGAIVFLLIWAAYRFDTGTIEQAHLDVPRAGSALHIAAQYAQTPGYEWVRADLVQRYRQYGEMAEERGKLGIDFVDWAKAAGYPSPLAARSGRNTMEGAPPIPEPGSRDRLLEPLRRAWQSISLRASLPAPFFIAGLQLVAQHSRGGHPAYLLGQFSDHGWWYYFPVVWFFKTPIPFIVLSLAGIVMAARYGRRTRNAEVLAVAIAPAILFIPTMIAGINIGVRHILPIYPLLAIVAAFAIREMWKSGHLPRLAALALIVWQLISTTAAHPDYLAWFNGLAGDHPEEIAVDSNLDWGQDLLRLVDVTREANISRLYLSYFGSAEPRRHALPFQPLQPRTPVCGWIAISEMNLKFGGAMGGEDNRGQNFRWLLAYEPVRRVGKSIRLYNVPCR